MRILLALIISVITISCQPDKSRNTSESDNLADTTVLDNPELITIYEQDQADRSGGEKDWGAVFLRDSARLARVYQLIDSSKLNTALDYKRAAMILQHGHESEDYKMAMDLMKKSLELDSTGSKWLLAATTDRYLKSIGKPQIYGTQYSKQEDGTWSRSPMDTTKVTDKERIKYGVRTLEEQRRKEAEMNSDASHSH